MRALHLGATSAWLGSGLLYLLTRPTAGQPASRGAGKEYGSAMRMLAGRSFLLSVASGVYLLFDRLANPRIGLAYAGALAAKLAIVAAIALLVSVRPRRAQAPVEGEPRLRWSDPGWQALALGVAALLLGVLLTLIYEAQAGVS